MSKVCCGEFVVATIERSGSCEGMPAIRFKNELVKFSQSTLFGTVGRSGSSPAETAEAILLGNCFKTLHEPLRQPN